MTRAELELVAKVALGIALVGLHYLLWFRATDRGWAPQSIERASWAVWALTRPVLAIALFAVLDLPITSDAARFYLPQGLAALRGELVYRDFASSYGPLFPYLAGAWLALAPTPEMLLAASIALEGVAIALWSRLACASVDAGARAHGLLFYACAPIAVWTTAIAGHNQSWLSAMLALVVAALARDALARAAVAVVAGAAFVKALGLLAAPYVLALAALRDRATLLKTALAFVLAALIAFAPFVWLGARVWQPLLDEAALATSGNLPFLLSWLIGAPRWSTPLLVIAIGSALSFELARRAGRARAAHHAALCALMLAIMLVSRKAYTTYLVLFWLPACFVVASQGLARRDVLSLSGLSLVAMLEPALWFDWMLPAATLAESLERPSNGVKVALFFACEIALIAGYIWLLRRALRALVPSPLAAGAQRAAPQPEAR